MNVRVPESSNTSMRWCIDRPEAVQYVIDGQVFYAYKANNTANLLADGDSIDIVVTAAPGVAPGFGFVARIGGTAELDVYEDVTDVTGGTIFVPRNRNRTSDRVSQVGVIINPTTVTATNPLYEEQVIGGTGGNASGATVSVNYAVIKSDTSYLFRLINRSGKARVAELYLQWSE